MKKNKRKTTRKVVRRKTYRPALPLNGFADQCVCKHRYTDQFTIQYKGTDQQTSSKSYSCNSMYDPNATIGVGQSQPRGFDEMMAVYKKYHVLGSKATIRAVFNDQTSATGIVWGCKLSGNTGTLAGKTVVDLMEIKGTRSRISQVNTQNASFTRGQQVVVKYSPKRIHGTGFVMSDRNEGNDGSDPSEQEFFETYVCPLRANNSGTLNAHFIITIDYICKYTDRKFLPQS